MGLSSMFEKGAAKRRGYQPGDAVPFSGIYRVTHHNRHTPDHDVTCVSDHIFPVCNECGTGAEFKLLHAVRLLDKHELFRQGGTWPRAGRAPLPWTGNFSSGETEVV